MNINLNKTDIILYYLLISLTIIFCLNPLIKEDGIENLINKNIYYKVSIELSKLDDKLELLNLGFDKNIILYSNAYLNLSKLINSNLPYSNNHGNEKFHFEGEIKVKKKRKDGPKRML